MDEIPALLTEGLTLFVRLHWSKMLYMSDALLVLFIYSNYNVAKPPFDNCLHFNWSESKDIDINT